MKIFLKRKFSTEMFVLLSPKLLLSQCEHSEITKPGRKSKKFVLLKKIII